MRKKIPKSMTFLFQKQEIITSFSVLRSLLQILCRFLDFFGNCAIAQLQLLETLNPFFGGCVQVIQSLADPGKARGRLFHLCSVAG